MCLLDAQLTVNQILRAYHHDEPLLFLAAAFITVGIVAAAFCLIRRRFDPLLVHLAIFANLYGQRLRLTSEFFIITHHPNHFFFHLQAAINYLVPIPAFAFFEAAGFMGRRGKAIVIGLSAVFLTLVVCALVFGRLPAFDIINNLLIVVAIPGVLVQSHLLRNRDRDFRVLQLGMLCFVLPSICDNIAGTFGHRTQIEPYGFAIFLASLGYFAARRLLRRDQELNEVRGELELATRIQLSILPTEFPASAHFRAAARYLPMTSVAGDFYDFLNLGPTQAGLLIADVSGHGVPAALIASMVKMAALSQSANVSHPAQLLKGMNAALYDNTQDQFVTAAYVYLDAQTKEFRYSAAGHPAMLLLRDGAVTEVIENGFVLAVTESATFTQLTHPLQEGDRLILYTDGLLEARNNQGQLFGEDNLHAIVRQTATVPAIESANQIIAKVEAWSRSQDDDLTVIVCDFIAAA
jgi:sigma-B regulation protein RsbU (phosphoserine phosphatase)